jgi:hypothetical protein
VLAALSCFCRSPLPLKSTFSLVSMQLRSFAFGASSVTDVALAPTGALVRSVGLRLCSAVLLHACRRRNYKTKSGKASEAAAPALRTPVARLPLLSKACLGVRGPMNQNQNKTKRCAVLPCLQPADPVHIYRCQCCLLSECRDSFERGDNLS